MWSAELKKTLIKLKEQQLSDRLATLLEDGISASAPTHQHSVKDSSRGNKTETFPKSDSPKRKNKVGKPKERLTNTTSSIFHTASASCKITAITSMLTRGEKPVPEKEDSPLHLGSNEVVRYILRQPLYAKVTAPNKRNAQPHPTDMTKVLTVTSEKTCPGQTMCKKKLH